MDISCAICFLKMKFCTVGYKIIVEESVSQFFYSELSFYVMLEKGNFWSFFKHFILGCIN